MLPPMAVMDPPMVGTIILNAPADGDEQDGRFCHYRADGRLLCGAPVAPGRRGLHRGGTDGNRECTGCGRPRCPTCERLRRERG
jgi:hypothetical protein